MVKRYLNEPNAERFETVKECIESVINDEDIKECYYYFTENGNCSIDLFESTRAHIVDPKEMVRIAEKFFNEFDWVHFEGYGKNGKTYISCFLDEETNDSFVKKLIDRDEKRKNKILSEMKNDKSKDAFINAVKKMRTIKEWEEKQ